METKPTPPVRLRVANEEDISFIFNSWLKSFRSAQAVKGVVNTIYFSEQHKLIERLLKTSQVLVACNNEDSTQVYGWAVGEVIDGIFCLHYIYVKHSFRNMGIAKVLLKALGHNWEVASCYTHHTFPMEKLSIKFNLVFHPYILINYNKPKEAVSE